ncbi:MAG TPA: RdgB/HAM1 family non-canonical purine NTP pyrophosphatase [bacterium]|nr:RdgB/HAM1 family non-canonical purine NTP pyrophosphatase [bacterium]
MARPALRRRAPAVLRPRRRSPAVAPAAPGALEVVLATRNPGKVREFLELMRDLPIQVYSLEAFPQIGELPEDGLTYTENAISKAITVARLTGRIAVADDSGLEVDALNGRPGPLSRRFLGDAASDAARNARILKLLQAVPPERRTARYRAVVAVALPGGEVRTFEGLCEGKIAPAPRGAGGFGYDPIFLVPAYGKTMAQLPLAVKNRLSHRSRAFAAARTYIKKLAMRQGEAAE